MLQHLFQVEPVVFFAHGDLLSKPFDAFVDHLGVFKVLDSRSVFPVWALSIDFVELHSSSFLGQLPVVESQSSLYHYLPDFLIYQLLFFGKHLSRLIHAHIRPTLSSLADKLELGLLLSVEKWLALIAMLTDLARYFFV